MERRSINIILFGPPGAGKGTQAYKLAAKYGLNHISTGEVIRDEIASQSELGRSMEEYIAKGELAPDALVCNMVADFVERKRDTAGNIYDGFPRTIVQAEEFDRIMSHHGLQVDAMLCLMLPDDESVKRLLLRGLESGRADDVSEEVIRNRLEVYHEMTEEVASYYRSCGKLFEIDGTGTIDEIFKRLCQAVDMIKWEE